MVFARSLRATTASQSLRTTPVARRPGQVLGRRFYASGKGGEEHRSSDLPWMLGSVGIGGPVIAYLATSGPEKKPHYGHGAHKEEPAGTEEKESPPEPVEEPQEEKESAEKEGRAPSQEEKVGSEKTGHDEPAAMKPPAGVNSISAKQEGLSNADTANPYVNEPGKSEKGEGETETAKVKGTVTPDWPQK